MSALFPRHCHTDYPIAVAGDGCYLIDSAGKRYFDGSGGAAVSCLGHSNENVKAAIKRQVDQLAFAHTGFFGSEPAQLLADALVNSAPGDISRVYFVSGGSEAIESALKLARQYFVEQGQPQRRHVIARQQSYHGNTLGALAAGGNAARRAPFQSMLMDVSHIVPCYEYGNCGESETTEAYAKRTAVALETEILALGPENVMAFLAEPVVGATLGAVTAVPGYFKRIREICDRYGVLLILDEVMCGMGRTGTLFAYEAEDITPDIVCIAKGLGAGYQPIGAMLCTESIYATIAEGSGFFQHGHTYLGHPVAAAGALAVYHELTKTGLLSRVHKTGDAFRAMLTRTLGQHPHVGDIRGRGLFIGIELVASRESKQPFERALNIAGNIKQRAFAEGLICYPMQGTRDGVQGDHILLAPPFIATPDQLEQVAATLLTTINTVCLP